MFPQLQLAHSCISFISLYLAAFSFLFCHCFEKRRLFLITVLHLINERQQCANERDCGTRTRCASTAFWGFLESLFLSKLPPSEAWRWGRTKQVNSNVLFSWIQARASLRMQQSEMPQTLTQGGHRMGLSIPGAPQLLVVAIFYAPSYPCK